MKKDQNFQELPGLFGNQRVSRSVAKRKSGFSKQNTKRRNNKRRSRDNDQSVLTLFDLDSLINPSKTESELKQENNRRLARITALGKRLSFNLKTGLDGEIYIQHQLLAENKLEAREYVLEMVNGIGDDNGLVILPTGLGKTYLAITIILKHLSSCPSKKILFLAPTKPLVWQHVLTLQSVLPKIRIEALTGHVPKKKRANLWNDNQIIVATPQTIVSELKNNTADNPVGRSSDLALLIIDEVHHQVGNYDYVKLARLYQEKSLNIQILGLTASPDLEIGVIKKLMKQLRIKFDAVQARSFDSPDVLIYTYQRENVPHYLNRYLTSLQKQFKVILSKNLTEVIGRFNKELTVSINNFVYWNDENQVVGIKVKEFNQLKADFIKGTFIPKKRVKAYKLLGLYGLAMVYNSALRANNGGLPEFINFLERQYNKANKERKRFQLSFCLNYRVQSIIKTLYFERLWKNQIPAIISNQNWKQNPDTFATNIGLNDSKLGVLFSIIKDIKDQSKQILIFTNYRDTLRKVKNYLVRNLLSKKVGILTGTSSKLNDPGMSHQDQLKTLANFREGKIDILVSTSVGEEGLDFPAVDTIVFYEPISDIRRYIQRLGRTARHAPGVVHTLIYRETEEEIIFYTSRNREKKIKQIIKYLQNQTRPS